MNVPCQNVVIQHSTFANGHGGMTIGSEMTGGVREVYARDLTHDQPGLQSGHRIKTNSVRGGFIDASHVWRVTASTIGGPLLLIDFNYGEGDTGTFPPMVTDINLTDWTVAARGRAGTSPATRPTRSAPCGCRTSPSPRPLTTANIATNISDLQLTDVTINGAPQ